MAGIDNNTVLYLRGDSFTDLSLNPKTIINNGITISDSGIFSKSLDFTSTNNATVTLPTFLDNPFTVDWYEYDIGNGTNGQISTIFTNVIKNSSGSNYNNYGFAIITNSVDGDNVLDLSTVPNSTWDICTNKSIGNDRPKQWVHRSIVYDGTNVRSYENGIKYMEFNLNGKKILSTYNTFQFNRWRENTTYPSWRYVKNFRISNVVRYTEDFTPPTKLYNSITINKTNQTDTNIEFNIEKLGQETINKVEVLVNGTVSKTYSDNYDNIDYLIDTELCTVGNNNITIRVTFDDTYTEELSLTHNITIDELPLETPLLDTVERVKLLTKSKQNEKNMLSSILTSKNIEVSEEDKMSDLIGKVDLLGDVPPPPLYLYKDGDECTDVTGGIEILFKWEVANYGNNSFGNKYSNYIRLEANGVNSQESGIGAYTVNKIDLTKYSKLCFEYLSENFTHSYGVMFSASSDKPTSCYKGDNKVAYVFETKNPTNKITTLTIDISQITGSYYISGVARASGATTCKADLNIYKIWLEK